MGPRWRRLLHFRNIPKLCLISVFPQHFPLAVWLFSRSDRVKDPLPLSYSIVALATYGKISVIRFSRKTCHWTHVSTFMAHQLFTNELFVGGRRFSADQREKTNPKWHMWTVELSLAWLMNELISGEAIEQRDASGSRRHLRELSLWESFLALA